MPMTRFSVRVAAAALATPALVAPGAPVPTAVANDALVGLWSYRAEIGPALHGELTVARRGPAWRAEIGAAKVEFRAPPTRIEFAFPDGGGAFRGALGDQGLRGFWVRPAITGDPRHPGGSTQAFATPLLLRPAGSTTWRGTVRPLGNPFTLYLSIFRGDDGALMAAFRNPEQHSHGPAMQYRVAQAADVVRFTAGQDPQAPEIRLEATLMRAPDRLRIVWPDAGGAIELERRTPAQAPGFFPRPPGSAPYAYRPPPETGDGWVTARAGDVGIDEDAVTAAVQEIVDVDPAARRPSLIHSFLLARNGKLVVEEYFYGYGRDTPHDLRSAGKTFASVLLGAAMKDGTPLAPESRITEVMRSRGPFAHPDSRKNAITLAHLMTHSAGLACDDNDNASPGNENTLQTQTAQPDWWKYTLDLPMAHDPGTRYAYCSANINLVGGALTVATGTWLPRLFAEQVAVPLRFGEWHWNLTPTGEGYLGGGAFLRPRDLLKVGQVYLNDGSWNGERLVTADWVRRSTAPAMRITPKTTGLSPDDFSNAYIEGADGLAWHLMRLRAGERSYDAFAATGNGGQQLVVIPALSMTAVLTGGNYRQGGIWLRWPGQLLGGHIIPGLKTDKPP